MAVSLCCMQQCDQLSYAQAIFRLLELSLLGVTAFAVTMQEQRQLIAGNSSLPMSFFVYFLAFAVAVLSGHPWAMYTGVRATCVKNK